MKKIVYMMLIACFVSACSSEQQDGIFAYKDAYIGDASSVNAIVQQLDGAEHFMQMELYTDAEPYGMQLYYEELSEAEMLTNATYIFTLVQNVDWVHYTIGEQGYELTRQQLEDIYEVDLRNIHDEALLQQQIEDAQKTD
ncbi:MAG: DUF4825 domain-containing protein [Caryophanon sp.]|nr:DUF4825 domain-containing protein [Caryophanon sp.]